MSSIESVDDVKHIANITRSLVNGISSGSYLISVPY